MINFISQNIRFELKGKNSIRRWVNSTIKERGYKIGEINIIFVSDNRLLEINRSSLGHNYYTDIITFDYSAEILNGKIYADLYISIDSVEENSKTYKQLTTNKFEGELCRVIIHGILHLTGEDDLTKSKQIKMRKEENKYLQFIVEQIDNASIKCSYKKD